MHMLMPLLNPNKILNLNEDSNLTICILFDNIILDKERKFAKEIKVYWMFSVFFAE